MCVEVWSQKLKDKTPLEEKPVIPNSTSETWAIMFRLQHEGTKPKQRKLKTAEKGAFTRGRARRLGQVMTNM